MIWGYPYFRKPPNEQVEIILMLVISSLLPILAVKQHWICLPTVAAEARRAVPSAQQAAVQ